MNSALVHEKRERNIKYRINQNVCIIEIRELHLISFPLLDLRILFGSIYLYDLILTMDMYLKMWANIKPSQIKIAMN